MFGGERGSFVRKAAEGGGKKGTKRKKGPDIESSEDLSQKEDMRERMQADFLVAARGKGKKLSAQKKNES